VEDFKEFLICDVFHDGLREWRTKSAIVYDSECARGGATVESAPVALRATSAGSTDQNIEEKANAKV
jgi:hypothetical protein